MSTEPITHKTINLHAEVDGKTYDIAQARVPVYATFDARADDLRAGVTFRLGDPIISGYEGHGEKAVKSRQILDQWKKKAEAELNHPAGKKNGAA